MRRITMFSMLLAAAVLGFACGTGGNTNSNTNANTTVTASPSPANANVHGNMNASEHANMANHNMSPTPKSTP